MIILQDDEYVVYSPDQVKLKYVVQFSVEGEQLKEFSPAINTSAELGVPSLDQQETGIVLLKVRSLYNNQI